MATRAKLAAAVVSTGRLAGREAALDAFLDAYESCGLSLDDLPAEKVSWDVQEGLGHLLTVVGLVQRIPAMAAAYLEAAEGDARSPVRAFSWGITTARLRRLYRLRGIKP